MRLTIICSLLLFVVFPVVAAGCGERKATDADNQKNELSAIYECYGEYMKVNKRPPQKLADLRKYEVMHGLAIHALNEGKCVLVWGVTSTDGGTVLAFQKDVPKDGGFVLMANGSIRTMSPSEFQAAKPNK